MGCTLKRLETLDEGAGLDEVEEDHEWDADEDHGQGEAPVCHGDGEFCNAKDGLVEVILLVFLLILLGF